MDSLVLPVRSRLDGPFFMEKNRAYFKKLLADHSLEILYDELFALLSWHQTKYGDKIIAEKYDELVLLSGKLNSVQQSLQLGTIDPEDMNTEVSRINHALLDLLNELPDSFFQQVQHVDTAVATGAKKLYTISPGIGNGLFWMGSMVMLMITLGSAVQKNWITVVFTLLATLICMPPTFEFLANKFKISLSGSIRVLLIIVLTSVGLSFAPPAAERNGKQENKILPKAE